MLILILFVNSTSNKKLKKRCPRIVVRDCDYRPRLSYNVYTPAVIVLCKHGRGEFIFKLLLGINGKIITVERNK